MCVRVTLTGVLVSVCGGGGAGRCDVVSLGFGGCM